MGLAHLIEDCPGTAEARAEGGHLTLPEALAGDPDVDRLRQRVRVVGRAVALAVAGLATRRREAVKSGNQASNEGASPAGPREEERGG